MKKTLLLTLEFPPDTGGVSAYYKNICEELPPQDLCVLAPEKEGCQMHDKEKLFTIYRREFYSKTFFWPKWARLLRTVFPIIKKENVQNILVGNILPLGYIAYVAKMKYKIPYFIFTHGMDVAILHGRKKFFAKQIFQNASGVFTNTHFTKHIVESYGYSHEQIATVYPCPDFISHAPPMEIARLKKIYNFYNKKILLIVGRIVERKGHDMVIRSLPRILQKFPDTLFVIVGEGIYRKNLEQLVKDLQLGNHVLFTGKLSRIELSAMYELCDIFVMPARQLYDYDVEGFGIVYLEANYFGKPVIGGKSGGVSEAVLDGVTGLLVDPQNSKDFVIAVFTLLENTDFAHRLGYQGMDRVHSQFHWSRQAEKIKSALG